MPTTIDDDTEEDNSKIELRAPTTDWSKYVGYKTVQYIKLGDAPRFNAKGGWDTAETVRRADKRFARDLNLLLRHNCHK